MSATDPPDHAVLDHNPFPPWLIRHCPILEGIERNPVYAAFRNRQSRRPWPRARILVWIAILCAVAVGTVLLIALVGRRYPFLSSLGAMVVVSAFPLLRLAALPFPTTTTACFFRAGPTGSGQPGVRRELQLELLLSPTLAEDFLQAVAADYLRFWRVFVAIAAVAALVATGLATLLFLTLRVPHSHLAMFLFWASAAVALSLQFPPMLGPSAIQQMTEFADHVLHPLQVSPAPYGAWVRRRGVREEFDRSCRQLRFATICCCLLGVPVWLSLSLRPRTGIGRVLSAIPCAGDIILLAVSCGLLLWAFRSLRRLPARQAKQREKLLEAAGPFALRLAILRRHLAGDDIEIAEIEHALAVKRTPSLMSRLGDFLTLDRR